VAEVFPNANVYRPVFHKANYAPWVEDEGFQKIYSAVRGHTLVDIYRLWELWCLVGETQHLPGNLLEIGVWRGGSAAVMAARLMREDGPSLYLCDTFYGVVKAGPLDSYYRGGEHADTSPQVVMQLLENNLPDARVKILNGVFPEETGAQVVDQIFRLVHVDVDVYQSADDILNFVWPRMPSGGVVVYDDYGFSQCAGIAAHVNEQRGMADRLVLHNLNGHAVVIKR
jgi:O-methyltransferase